MSADASGTLAVAGAAIVLNGTPCDAGATTASVDLIDISGGSGDDVFAVDLTGGPFAPGAEAEGTGISEIEFAVALGGGTDRLDLIGVSGKDQISFGGAGGNLDHDDDVDVTLSGVESLGLIGGDGADDLSAGGDGVVGGPLTIAVSVDGGPGNDVIVGGNTADLLAGGDGTDRIGGGAGADSFDGGSGNDEIGGGAGTDEVDFSGAPDTEDVYLAMNKAFGGGGVDTIEQIENVIGSAFPDLIVGDGSSNQLSGGGGNDILNGSGGDDVIRGDAGLDTAAFFGSPAPLTVNLGSGTAIGWGSDTLETVENVHGSAFADVLTGSAGANVISGSGGDDLIRGGPGSDHLFGNPGNDKVQPGPGSDEARGGSGIDRIDLSTATTGVTINLASGKTTGQGADLISGFERAKGSAFADVITGSGAANLLIGGSGDDRLSGSGRADRLLGGPGLDTLFGGGAADVLLGGLHHDVANGGGGDDVLTGGAGPDLLHGNAGNDAFDGGSGTDTCHQDAGSGPKSSCELPP